MYYFFFEWKIGEGSRSNNSSAHGTVTFLTEQERFILPNLASSALLGFPALSLNPHHTQKEKKVEQRFSFFHLKVDFTVKLFGNISYKICRRHATPCDKLPCWKTTTEGRVSASSNSLNKYTDAHILFHPPPSSGWGLLLFSIQKNACHCRFTHEKVELAPSNDTSFAPTQNSFQDDVQFQSIDFRTQRLQWRNTYSINRIISCRT